MLQLVADIVTVSPTPAERRDIREEVSRQGPGEVHYVSK